MSGSDRLLFIDSRSASSGTPVLLNANPPRDTSFLVRKMVMKVTVNAEASAGTVTPGFNDFGANSKVEAYWLSTGDVWLNNVSFAALDIWAQRQHSNLDAFQGYAINGQSFTTAGETQDYYFEIPLFRPNAYRGEDYIVSLAEIGQFTVTVDTTVTNLTTNSITIELFACGQNAQPGVVYQAGTLTRLDYVSGESGNDVYLQSYGHLVRDLWEQSATATSIADEVGPRVELDGREVTFARGIPVSETDMLWQDAGQGAKVSSSANDRQGQTRMGSLLPAQTGKKISQLPSAQTVHISYSARTGTPADMRFALETVYPSGSGSRLLQRIPGATALSAAQVVETISRPGVTNAPSIETAAFLPAVAREV